VGDAGGDEPVATAAAHRGSFKLEAGVPPPNAGIASGDPCEDAREFDLLSRVPLGYDWSQSTQRNYAAEDSSVTHQYGAFTDIRSQLDAEYHGCYTQVRQSIQDMWVHDIVQGGMKHEHPWIIFTAGAMGAGKGFAIQWMSQHGHFPLPDIVQIDPDRVRQNMVRENLWLLVPADQFVD
jgi:hypothetical protein